MVGSTISHYRIVAKLGEGGMGVVYKAEDINLRRPAALKFLAERFVNDRVALQRLQREARAASALNHPNICTVYEVGEAEGQTFIAMEFVEGRALSALIPAEGLPEDQLLRYGKQIAEALAHSHDHGIIHRDLKSSNVMVTPEGRVKVLDFGLAKVTEAVGPEGETATAMTREGTVVGTLAYLPPEVLRGEPAGSRSDIWSFGVLLYEMAAGRLPFQGRGLFEVSAAVLREPVPELPDRVSAGVRAILGRCLMREPGERYQRGGEVRAAIESIESARQLIQPAASRRANRRRWLWMAGGTATLAAAGAVGVLWPRKPRVHAPLPSKVPEANEYFRRARVFLDAQIDLPRARPLLEKSLELDPHFADARAWYGLTHVLLIDSGLSNDTAWLYKAEAELRLALEDDPNSAGAHASLAMVYLYQGRKELVVQEAGKAIALDPNEKNGANMLATCRRFDGNTQLAHALWKKILDLDPLYFPARWNVGETLREMGDPDGSIREQEKVLQQDPKNVGALLNSAMAHMCKGDVIKARQMVEQAEALEPRNYWVRMMWALQLALEGKKEAALKEMDAEVLKYCEFVYYASNVAEFYAVLGEKTKALDWIERAVRVGDERAEWFHRDPMLANVRDEPRFQQILESIRYRREKRGSKSP